MLLHENPDGKVEKVWLTIKAVGVVKGDDINGKNL
jgi:hypothetical protein